MAKKMKHLHQYKKVKLSHDYKPGPAYYVYRCMLPTCTHYLRLELIEGRECQCARCHLPMIVDKAAMELVTIHCADCVVKKPATIQKEREREILANINPEDIMADINS